MMNSGRHKFGYGPRVGRGKTHNEVVSRRYQQDS